MLTGFSECTGGEVLFEGYNIFANMGKLRRSLGYCPQHDILYPDLTVFEQMQIMGACRGVPSAQLENEIANLLDDLHLANQRNVLTKNLSGGQKRKLSTAIAFLGGNRLIFLDEPSSGLDTQVTN
jgi:ATP-binding cassette, subfamily A (ABC1), member 3